jgi:hypothetical protein
MAEIACALGRLERENECADASLQPVDCALGSFSQERLQGMEHHLDRIELRRILRKVPQFCPASLDRLLDAGDLVERNIVEDHDVPSPQRRSETLLDVGQERFAVHGSLDQHRGDDTGLTEAGNEGQRFPAPHRNITKQAFSAWTPTVEADHVGGNGRLINKYQTSGVKKSLLAYPASACPSHVGALSLRGPQAFF